MDNHSSDTNNESYLTQCPAVSKWHNQNAGLLVGEWNKREEIAQLVQASVFVGF